MKRRVASSIFSEGGCGARISSAGAKLLVATLESSGGKSACLPREFARKERVDASRVVRRARSRSPSEELPAGPDPEGAVEGLKNHSPVRPTGFGFSVAIVVNNDGTP